MRDSEGKRVARAHFYEQCLPRWIAPSQLASQGFLMLLGGVPEGQTLPPEIPFLDAFQIPRERIWSVERDVETYRFQQSLRLGVSLYRGELKDYLDMLLQSHQHIGVLNLDIEGSYLGSKEQRDRKGIDQAMTSVLLFCWRNPETVVATYSSIGRDRTTLIEGMVSLLLFMRIDAAATLAFCRRMFDRYVGCRMQRPLFMVWRDLVWLRSIMEHAMVTTSFVYGDTLHQLRLMSTVRNLVWKRFQARSHSIQTMAQLQAVATELFANTPDSWINTPCIGLGFADQEHVLYRAQRPWSQRCYFMMLRRMAATSPGAWLVDAYESFLRHPLMYIDEDGGASSLVESGEGADLSGEELLDSEPDLIRRFTPRNIPDQPEPAWRETIDSIRCGLAQARRATLIQAIEGESVDMARRTNTQSNGRRSATAAPAQPVPMRRPRNLLDRSGKPTDDARDYIKHLANERGLNASEILDQLPDGFPAGTVRAFVAHASRAKKA